MKKKKEKVWLRNIPKKKKLRTQVMGKKKYHMETGIIKKTMN